MKTILICIVTGNLLFAERGEPEKNPSKPGKIRDLYQKSQLYYQQKNYEIALDILTTIHKNPDQIARKNILGLIHQIGRIYLTVQWEPEKALAFFKKSAKLRFLSEEEKEDIEEWIEVTEEWKSLHDPPGKTGDKDALFSVGQKYYRTAKKKSKSPLDPSGNLDFELGGSYLVPFVLKNDGDPRVGEALFMLGEIRMNTYNDRRFWTQNFYFKEVIRRFPHSDLAMRAWKMLKKDTELGHSGSGGDFTSRSAKKMLETYHELAAPKKKKSPEKK